MRLLPQPVWTLVFASAIMRHAVNAISLSDFTPKITSQLSSTCEIAYTTTIPGCLESDFENGGQCSSSCLSGLVQIDELVQSSCAEDFVSASSILGLFLEGEGIQVLCNVAVVTQTTGKGGAASTPKPITESIGSSIEHLSSQSVPTNGIITDTGKPTAPSTTTSSTQSTLQLTSTPAVVVSSTSKSTVTTTVNVSSKTSSSKTTSTSQGGNSDSGGGSPFDNPNSSTRAVTVSFATAVLSIALGVILLLR